MEALAENQEIERPFDNSLDKPKKLDLAEIFKLRFRNRLSLREIASRFGVHHSSIDNMLQTYTKLIKNPDEINVYDMNRAGILTALEFEIIKQMSDESKLKSASFNNLAYGASQINNMIRLEKGQPTSITESLDSDLSGLLDRIAPMKSAGSGSTVDVSPAVNTFDDVDNAVNQAIGLPAPPADRSTSANLEAPIQPVEPAKCSKARKSASKSIVKSRKQNACNITATLNSKVDEVKQGVNTVTSSANPSTPEKQWYE